MTAEAEFHSVADLRVGMTAEFERRVGEQEILDFARSSGDFNPLHVNAAYAAKTNYGRCIAHGAFQVGLASAMLGMRLPGRSALLTDIHARFPAALNFPSTVRVHGEIVAWNPGTLGGRLRVTITDRASGTVTAEIGVGFSLHEEVPSGPAALPAKSVPLPDGQRSTVIVTGASGGIGRQVVRVLLESYRVVAVYNRTPLDNDLKANSHLRAAALDFEDPAWPAQLARELDGGPLYGVVHGAWPGLPQGGLLSLPADVIQVQLSYGAGYLIELARLLHERSTPQGGRLVAIGSVFGSAKPILSLAAYSLAKATMEHAVRLLAAELAPKRITANAVCPSFVPVGMNQQADQRRRKMEAARVPLGRLCQADDVAAAVRWFLSPEASFVSGQVLALTGAQL